MKSWMIPLFALLLPVTCLPVVAQWSSPHLIDSTAGEAQFAPRVAIGPEGRIAVVWVGTDSDGSGAVYCETSTDQGTTFARGIALQFVSNPLFGIGRSIDQVGFDSLSGIWVLLRTQGSDCCVGWTELDLLRSRDGGLTFSTVWSGGSMCNMGASPIIRSPMVVKQNSVYIVSDSCDYGSFPQGRWILLKAFSAGDTLSESTAILPMLTTDLSHLIYLSLTVTADTIDYVFADTTPDSSAYYIRSTDGGKTFGEFQRIDGPAVSVPQIARQCDGSRFISYVGGAVSDSVLRSRTIEDSVLSQSFRLAWKKAVPGNSVTFLSDSVSDHLVYWGFGSEPGMVYYEFQGIQSMPTDSAFFPGLKRPDMTIDTLGGLYLVAEYDNKVFLTTKDVVLGLPIEERTLPNQFTLFQNYPNPFNPSTTISFSIPHSGDVSLKIFNLLGEEAATLVSVQMDAGIHTVQWDASDLSSGMYFYRLRARQTDGEQAGEFVETRKLLLLK